MIIGLVGKPSAGKSTFFKAATLAEVEIANYPFVTIKPNHGTGYIKIECVDKEFGKQCNPRFGYCLQGKRFVPVDLLDVAGLVPGAHEGKGMGNQFLDDLRQAHALIHVVDVSGSVNENGEPVPPGSYDPAKDIIFLEEELDLWYCGILKKGWERFARQVKQEKQEIHKALGKQLSGLGVDEEMVKEELRKSSLGQDPTLWGETELLHLAQALRRRTKPLVIACNKIDVPYAEEHFVRLQKQFPQHKLIPCSAEAEIALREAAKHELIRYIPGEDHFEIVQEKKLTLQQKNALTFIEESVLKKQSNTGVQQVLDYAVLTLLKYKAIFPGGVNKLTDSDGNVLPDCFLLPEKATALDFAYHLHTDFGKNFIKAINVKTKMPVGRDHVLQHRDVIEIMSKK